MKRALHIISTNWVHIVGFAITLYTINILKTAQDGEPLNEAFYSFLYIGLFALAPAMILILGVLIMDLVFLKKQTRIYPWLAFETLVVIATVISSFKTKSMSTEDFHNCMVYLSIFIGMFIIGQTIKGSRLKKIM